MFVVNHDHAETVSDDDESLSSEDDGAENDMAYRPPLPPRAAEPPQRIARFAPDNYGQGTTTSPCSTSSYPVENMANINHFLSL